MKKTEYRKLFENEETHFYYTTLHSLVIHYINKYSKNRKLNILDAGCGTGFLTKKLEQFGSVIGIDTNSDAVAFSKSRNLNIKKASADNLPFKTDSFDLVTSIDVIYHIGVNDTVALKEAYRVLKPGGLFILRVPANNWIRTKHDKNVQTRKRYTKNEVANMVRSAKFEIKKVSYINMSLLIPTLLFNNKSFSKTNEFINYLFKVILQIENNILKYISLPQGVGIVCVAVKPLSDKVSTRK